MKIHRYAHRGDIAGVQQELERGVSIESIDTNARFINLFFEDMTPLQCALASPLAGKDMVEFLLDVIERKRRKSKLPRPPIQGKPDLHFAIQSGNIEKIQLLLDLGADINCIDENDNNVLINVLSQCNSQGEAIALVQFLIAKGINIDSGKRSALDLASFRGWFEIVRLLLEAGCDPAVLGWTDLMQAVILGTMSEVEVLLEKNADLTVIDACGRTPWLLSLHGGDVSKSQRLLIAGSNLLEIERQSGKLPLMYALESGNLSMLAWSIEMGADTKDFNRSGESTFELAVKLDRADAVSMLLETGKLPTYGVSESVYYVHSAEVLRLLLLAGADPSIIHPFNENSYYITPSIHALVTKVDIPDEWELGSIDREDCNRRFGQSNPEQMGSPLWREMVKFRWTTGFIYWNYRIEYLPPTWCFYRDGQSITLLPDGRAIEIGGEHDVDEEFCIYNDVVVYDGRGDFQIYGYPKDVFPPTDRHTATLVDNWIYSIGNVGYEEDRIVGETPVYRLNCTTFEIEQVITSGECPGWISKHTAVVQDLQIHITGGKVWTIEQDKPTLIDNRDEYVLDLTQFHWERQVKEERDIDWQEWVYLLRSRMIEVAPGLTDMEISVVESHFKFRFPPDLRTFLQTALPCGSGFPNWRDPDFTSLQEWFEMPLEGILFDVKHNFWLDEWGTRPEMLGDALKLVTDLLHSAPPLIPIYNHRMMPAEPHLPGNPVFSVHQTDIIHYGFDLDDYFRNEFHLPNRRCWPTQVRPIRFWDIDRFQSVRWGDDTGVRSMF